MTCCASIASSLHEPGPRRPGVEEVALASRDLGNGLRQITLSVPDMRCGACMAILESTIGKHPEVHMARANLTAKRVT
ncbi:cation transporter, partial [Rhizobium johnstonii]|uniref:cation transporter n=1 Tax=Rhizobium johnstonii TaxID=3019933 RepID=UPI003F9B9510